MSENTKCNDGGEGSLQVLNGKWSLVTDPENRGREQRWFDSIQDGAQSAPVPGVIQQVFPGYHGVAWYWHRFRPLRAPLASERVLLRFGAVDYLAEVWVNGVPVGGYEGGETPFELDITNALEAHGDNLLTVRALNPTTEPIDAYVLGQIPHRHKAVPFRCGACFNSGGIMYPVELRFVPHVHIADIVARPDIQTASIAVTVTVQNRQPGDASVGSLTLEIAPAAGGAIIQSAVIQVKSPPGPSEHKATLPVAQPHLWDLDDPFLYRVTATMKTEDGLTYQHSVRCGFRDFRVVAGHFQLNGRRIFVKSTHTCNSMPIGQQVAVIPDHVRRDLIYAKASGFNMVRFIAGVACPEQLDFCDEIGLMVYEECFAGWCLADSGHMRERFTRSTSDMIRRDRNHPCVTIWGLLNETVDGPVFRLAVSFLPALRALDDTRLVLLNSGRWDCQLSIGSVSNPGSVEWTHAWGHEGTDAKPTPSNWDFNHGGYFQGVGDAHCYPGAPYLPHNITFFRNIGSDGKPVFLSESGIGSLMDVVREWRHYEQVGARPDLEDAALLQAQSEAFYADWKRLGFEGVYPFPEDVLRESQRLHSRQRTIGFDLIRSNPRIIGYNLTGMLDHGITGEGLWTYWREWKPGTFDAVADGWSPLRWCLFVDPLHGYQGRAITVEAVLATEDALMPGEYPARFVIHGPTGIVWEKQASVTIPQRHSDEFPPLAVSVMHEQVKLDGPPGQYTFAANLERGGAPTGGRLHFTLSDPRSLPRLDGQVTLWGIDQRVEQWLTAHGLCCHPFDGRIPRERELILVGEPADSTELLQQWRSLARQMACGATVIFLCPKAFRNGKQGSYWLPLQNKGRCYEFGDWLYHKECVAKRHPIFGGLQSPGIMDWDYYGPVIPHYVFEEQDTPDETIAAAFATGHSGYPAGYGASLLIAAYTFGAGRFILNTPYIVENLDVHPAADRLLVNFIRYAQTFTGGPLAGLPADFDQRLISLGYHPGP